MPEYHIRKPDSETAEGPYDIPSLQGLLENGIITPDYLYFDEANGEWKKFSQNADLRDALFPEQKRLILKKREKRSTDLNADDESGKSITVDEILANAEAQSEQTKHLYRWQRWQERAIALCAPGMAAILILSAVGIFLPEFSTVVSLIRDKEWLQLLTQPLLVLGFVDLFLAASCILGATEAFPLIRLRAALGLGYFGYVYWALGNSGASISVIVASAGLFVATLSVNFFITLICIATGVVGMVYILVVNIPR